MSNKEKETKNANNKVDIMYNLWLGMRFDERELFNKQANEASIDNIRDLLEDE